MSEDRGGLAVLVPWVANPFRGDKFEAAWLPAAEAALDFGATGWAFFRSKEGLLDFSQWAFFDTKLDFERYWYGEEFGAWRADYSSWYQVPVVYTWADLVLVGGLEKVTE